MDYFTGRLGLGSGDSRVGDAIVDMPCSRTLYFGRLWVTAAAPTNDWKRVFLMYGEQVHAQMRLKA